MSNEYLTIKEEVIAQIEVEKSKFICYLYPCDNEEDAKSILKDIRKQHPKANHHCYAYIYNNGTYYKSSDDGEPGGTAGMPILNVLKAKNFNNIIAIVVRYFGGTLLGRGGLIRAYTHATEKGIENAQIYAEGFKRIYSITVDFSFYDIVNQRLNHPSLKIIDREFNEKVTVKVILLDEFDFNNIVDLTNGNAIINDEGESLYTYRV
ncbi:TPA: YigZ family protein [bacterium]|jgi:uncharacterized YigZ family protein|nr:YigZ family protein [bacterium]